MKRGGGRFAIVHQNTQLRAFTRAWAFEWLRYAIIYMYRNKWTQHYTQWRAVKQRHEHNVHYDVTLFRWRHWADPWRAEILSRLDRVWSSLNIHWSFREGAACCLQVVTFPNTVYSLMFSWSLSGCGIHLGTSCTCTRVLVCTMACIVIHQVKVRVTKLRMAHSPVLQIAHKRHFCSFQKHVRFTRAVNAPLLTCFWKLKL